MNLKKIIAAILILIILNFVIIVKFTRIELLNVVPYFVYDRKILFYFTLIMASLILIIIEKKNKIFSHYSI